MRYHHFAHMQEIAGSLTVGQKVTKGQSLGKVGKTGTTYAHLHYEVRNQKPPTWTSYIYGLSMSQVMELYADPETWIDRKENIPAKYTTYGGYEYLSSILDKNGFVTGYHSGIDLNEGSGNDDLGNPITSPINGVVVYRANNQGGWGTHLWIEEVEEDTELEEAMDWMLQHEIYTVDLPANLPVNRGELALVCQRLAERIISWTSND